jgi:hypothetical protein
MTASAVLQCLERGPALRIERHDFAIEHEARCLQRAKRRDDRRIVSREVLLIAREELHLRVVLDRERAVPSHFTSYVHASPIGSSERDVASIGSSTMPASLSRAAPTTCRGSTWRIAPC